MPSNTHPEILFFIVVGGMPWSLAALLIETVDPDITALMAASIWALDHSMRFVGMLLETFVGPDVFLGGGMLFFFFLTKRGIIYSRK